MPRLSPALLALAAAATLAGCATARPDPLLAVATADEGVVIDVRPIVRARPILLESPPESAAPATLAATPRPAAVQPPPVAATPAPARRLAQPGRRAAPTAPSAAPPVGPATSVMATAEQPVDVGVNVVGDAGAVGSASVGLAYTVRRTSDGAQIQIAQPPGTTFAQGAHVRILYGPRIRLAPLS